MIIQWDTTLLYENHLQVIIQWDTTLPYKNHLQVIIQWDTTLITDSATGVEDFYSLKENTNRYKASFLPSASSVFHENYDSH